MTEERERRFMLKLRQALMMIVRWIETEYDLKKEESEKRKCR
jgi:hypothetical protein